MGLIADRVERLRRGDEPTLICRVRSGWAVLGDEQFLPGYALVLADPVAADLNALVGEARAAFLADMAALGDAILAAPLGRPVLRVNYSIYGNLVPELHAHVAPRFADEPAEYATKPHWLYPPESRSSRPFDATRDAGLVATLGEHLRRSGVAFD